ncbi:phytanoyl-CoA dioxygenase family protein [Taibaiella lutea]|uniref:Phytanoyl-CoA dioxygenase family protein n=1 Tax=Taibaiella lutea TaxID=2608001 RepID=A0A5M6CEX1_9BACT|nr:phytanoyl-CoA dioxygenase family protein [Taibaiella lutea]KAA5532452.1 phytanoyl-CoA dioxygenase family protein [Taibaiella lutea]
MSKHGDLKAILEQEGFAVIPDFFTKEETAQILSVITNADTTRPTFRKAKDLFAIRQFLKEIPEVTGKIFNDKLKNFISEVFGNKYFVVKSIYFDKPGQSNWFVAYHQDLTISVDRKSEIPGFGPWTTKQNQFAVQPPLELLQGNFTMRIHLDDTDENNGALKVIPHSHAKGLYRPETIDRNIETETICNVPEGGIMLMKPLLLHASGKTTNDRKRRVIHIEYSSSNLPDDLNWSEQYAIF